MVLTNPLGVKTRSAIRQKKTLSLTSRYPKGGSVLDAAQTQSARKNYVHKQIKYLSPIIFVHSANRTFSIIIHQRVVRVNIQFCDQFFLLKKSLKKSRFNFHAFNLIHQFCTFI